MSNVIDNNNIVANTFVEKVMKRMTIDLTHVKWTQS